MRIEVIINLKLLPQESARPQLEVNVTQINSNLKDCTRLRTLRQPKLDSKIKIKKNGKKNVKSSNLEYWAAT